MLSPKYNKNNIPFRIIVSSINTVLHPIAFFFHSIIVSGMKKNSRQARNSFKIYKTLTGTRINDSVMISLDDFYVHKHFSRSCNKQHNEWYLISQKTNIPFNKFIEALKFFFFSLLSMFFSFNKKIYQQMFGTPMGSPLSPIIAELALQDLEEKASLKCFEL